MLTASRREGRSPQRSTSAMPCAVVVLDGMCMTESAIRHVCFEEANAAAAK